MRTFAGILAAAMIAAVSIAVAADTAPTTLAAGTEHWAPAPGPGGQGVMQAVLLGDPTNSRFYIARIKEPPNYQIMPHTHPNRQDITVLSGTYYFGLGSTFNKSAMTAYPAGSFISVPAGVAHYAAAGSSGAVLQEDGMGPSTNQMIKQ
jgi:quercetin dioxygenase-like cupin family protein